MRDHTIRIGIVGTGSNTVARHIPGLRACENVELVSVCNRTRESSQRVAGQFGIPNIYNHWQELVKASDTNAIVIGTWPYLHCPVTLAALSAGKHVLCEARMAMNAEEARRMLDAAEARPGLVTQIVPSPFTLGADSTIKHLENQGYFGKILAIDVRSMDGAFLDPDAPMDWRRDPEYSGRNIMTLGIWYEAIMRWVGEATRVQAIGRTFAPQRHAPDSRTMRTTDIPEHLDVTAAMACGAQAHFQISTVAGLSPANEACIWGSAGTVRFRDGALYGGQPGDAELAEIPIAAGERAAWRVEEAFINAIRGQERVTLTTFEDGLKYMQFTEAVNLSIERGKPVDLPLG